MPDRANAGNTRAADGPMAAPSSPLGWCMPDEADAHKATWMAYGASSAIWPRAQVAQLQLALVRIANAIAAYEPVNMLVRPSELAGARQLLPALCAVAFALIWLRAPGVNLGVMLALTAFASHRPALLATGLLGTGVYLIRYYYQLDVPLLEKSQWLLLGGVALLAIRFALTRIALRADAGDRP